MADLGGLIVSRAGHRAAGNADSAPYRVLQSGWSVPRREG
jgi:hypothetical protein